MYIRTYIQIRNMPQAAHTTPQSSLKRKRKKMQANHLPPASFLAWSLPTRRRRRKVVKKAVWSFTVIGRYNLSPSVLSSYNNLPSSDKSSKQITSSSNWLGYCSLPVPREADRNAIGLVSVSWFGLLGNMGLSPFSHADWWLPTGWRLLKRKYKTVCRGTTSLFKHVCMYVSVGSVGQGGRGLVVLSYHYYIIR